MKKAILIIGRPASGKSTKLKEILQLSKQVNTQIVATCQTGHFELTETLLSNFEVINCNV